jgi:hypothetical protein
MEKGGEQRERSRPGLAPLRRLNAPQMPPRSGLAKPFAVQKGHSGAYVGGTQQERRLLTRR